MSDPNVPPYSDGKSENFPPGADDVPGTYTAPGQVPTDNGGTVPDTAPTSPVDGPADTTAGSVEGGDTVSGSGPGVAEADPDLPAETEPEVQEAGETLETDVEAPASPLGPPAAADAPVEEPAPSVVDADLPLPSSPGESDNVWTVYHKAQKRWFTVLENHGVVGAAEGYHLKTDAQAEGRTEAKDRSVEHFIQKRDATIGEKNSYGGDPVDREG